MVGFTFVRPDGTPIQEAPSLPSPPVGVAADPPATSLAVWDGTPLDLAWAIDVLRPQRDVQRIAQNLPGAPRRRPFAFVQAEGLTRASRYPGGLDREAAKQAFAGFMEGRTFTANQIEFVDLIVNHLTEHGVMDVARLYTSPFSHVTPQGPEALFGESDIDRLVAALHHVAATARAA